MPRLSDLLPDNLKKQLFADSRKKALPEKSDRPVRRHPPAAPVRSQAPLPDFVAVDVETTGLDFSSDRVIEIGAVKFTAGKITGEYSSYVNPGRPIPAVISDLTTITDAETASAPSFGSIAPELLAFIGDLPLCGHQITFDLTFLNKELERAGLKPLAGLSLDTALLSRIIFESGTRYSLKSVSSKLSVSLENAHRALCDAKASGEIALQLIPRIGDLPLNVRQTMAAAAPASFFKTLLFQSLGSSRPRVILQSRPGEEPLPELEEPEAAYREIDAGKVRKIFSPKGGLEQVMPSFAMRTAQCSMADEVAGTFNGQSILLAEAGTGTGKSLAYLVPASLWALKNNCRVIVATRTRNLQDQLFMKDLPLVARVTDEALRYSVLKGRANYLCLSRFERLLLGEAGNLSVRERFAILPLIPWVQTTRTGDIEEQNQFNPKWFQKVWDLISADSRGCEGHRCAFFKRCFLQQARQKALSSHIVIINHALFFAELGGSNAFLGDFGSIVFDEAHHLESTGHQCLRVELDTNRISLYLEEHTHLVQSALEGKGGTTSAIGACGKELKSALKRARKYSQSFLESISAWARERKTAASSWNEYQIPLHEGDLASNIEAPAFKFALETLRDQLYLLKQVLATGTGHELDMLREEALFCQERTSQLLADLSYLVSALTEDHAFWVEGNWDKGWTKLCGVPLDIAALLSPVWAGCRGAVVFTSATLSVAGSMEFFFNSVGLGPVKERTTASQFPSPFSSSQAIMGAVKNAPDPDSREYPPYVASIVSDLHSRFKKNILVLFTANAALNEVYNCLKTDRSIPRQNVLAQNISGGRNAVLDQFKQDRQMILLGTDSFWEGIDVPGEACEIVIIARLPFPVPTHPLNAAIAEKMTRLHGESFMSYAVPEAVIRFRQGCGRLIRTATDRGALLVLDNRIVTKGYGRNFSSSLEGEFQTFDHKAVMLERVKNFFENEAGAAPASSVTYVPFDEV